MVRDLDAATANDTWVGGSGYGEPEEQPRSHSIAEEGCCDLEYLSDVEFPGRLLWRDSVLSDRPTVERSDEQGLLVYNPNPSGLSLALASLYFSDARKGRWIDTLRREVWTYSNRQHIAEKVEALQKFHKIIMSDLNEYSDKQVVEHTKGGNSPSHPFILERDEISLQHIKQQRDAILTLYTDLSDPNSSGGHRHTNRDPDAAPG
jgi:hypothetical protein